VPKPQSPNHLQPVGGAKIDFRCIVFSIVLKRFDCKDTIFLGKDKRNISFFELYEFYLLIKKTTNISGNSWWLAGFFVPSHPIYEIFHLV